MHPILHARLRAIRDALVAAYRDGGPSAVSGYVREQTFKQLILPRLPPQFRSTTGQIIDQYGAKTGQLDAIIENGHFPSVTAPSIGEVRLVLAEGTSSVIEVKSQLPSQWDEVLCTSAGIKNIRRKFRPDSVSRGNVSEQIPLFVVAYEGWRKLETLRTKIERSAVTGILVLAPLPLFAGRIHEEVVTGTEECAIWAFICALHFRASQLLTATCDLFAYGKGITES